MNEYYALSFILFFVTWFTLRHIYRNAVLPYLTDKYRFKLFALRDNLRRIEKENNCASDFSFRFMENVFNKAIKNLDRYSIVQLFLSMSRPQDDKLIKMELQRFDREAPPELKKMDRDYVVAVFSIMAFNSPLLMCTALILKLFTSIVQSSFDPIKRMKSEGRSFIHQHNLLKA